MQQAEESFWTHIKDPHLRQAFVQINRDYLEGFARFPEIAARLEVLKGAEPVAREAALAGLKAILDPEKIRRIQEWRASMRTPPYAQVLYHRARAAFQSFDVGGLILAHLEARRLREILGPAPRFALRPGWRDSLRGLALCLEVQSAALIALARYDEYTDVPIFTHSTSAPVEQGGRDEDYAASWERREPDGVRQLLALRSAKDEDLCAAALETLGLWARYKRDQDVLFPADPTVYFESALRLRVWPNTRVYLAESLHRDAPEDAKRFIALALQQAPKHVLARNLAKRLNGPSASAPLPHAPWMGEVG